MTSQDLVNLRERIQQRILYDIINLRLYKFERVIQEQINIDSKLISKTQTHMQARADLSSYKRTLLTVLAGDKWDFVTRIGIKIPGDSQHETSE